MLIKEAIFVKFAFYVKWSSNPFDKTPGSNYNQEGKISEWGRVRMIRIFKTEDGTIHEKKEMQPGSWIALTNPTASEILPS